MAKLNIEEFLGQLEEMSVLELNDLVKAIEEKFGVTAAADFFSPVLDRFFLAVQIGRAHV